MRLMEGCYRQVSCDSTDGLKFAGQMNTKRDRIKSSPRDDLHLTRSRRTVDDKI
jgi:hypothetical protein